MVDLSLSETITRAVATQYNAFPYPNYPLLAKPLWQDGYMASSVFVGNLLAATQNISPAIGSPEGSKNILLAGCGDTQPYVLRKLEPSSFKLTCVDLSRRNLKRAKFRLFPFAQNMSFVEDDLLLFAGRGEEAFDHIDSYGVLHHLANSEQTLAGLVSRLKPNGTMRVMVYNTGGRDWIHQLQSVFRLMDLDPMNRNDLNDARALLWLLARHMPDYSPKLMRIGRHTIENKARLVDTFFHARELRKSISEWFQSFRSSGLVPFALWDRYGELDDLPNPLWSVPSEATLDQKAAQQTFQGNLELYLYKPGPVSKSSDTHKSPHHKRWLLMKAPSFWQKFPETKELSFTQRSRLWADLSRSLGEESKFVLDKSIPMDALKRLARLGVLPTRQLDPALRTVLSEPLGCAESIEEPERQKKLVPLAVRSFISEILLQKKKMELKRLDLIEERLRRGAE